MTLFVGPVLGSASCPLLPELQRALGIDAGWIRPFISGVLLLVVILFLPAGCPASSRGAAARRTLSPGALPALDPLPAAGTELVSLTGSASATAASTPCATSTSSMQAGEILGLIGPNGAGKTTLVNMITGLMPRLRGRRRCSAPRSAARFAPIASRRPGCAAPSSRSSCSTGSPRWRTCSSAATGSAAHPPAAADLAALGPARERQALARHAPSWCGSAWARRRATPAGDLSYGDQRRLEIARALASHPSLLVLDEPAAGMNHVEASRLSELIRSLAADGIAVLVIEHNVRMMLETCDRIMVLNFGEVIAAGNPADIARDPVVLQAYLGSEGEGADETASELRAAQLAVESVAEAASDTARAGDTGTEVDR